MPTPHAFVYVSQQEWHHAHRRTAKNAINKIKMRITLEGIHYLNAMHLCVSIRLVFSFASILLLNAVGSCIKYI